MTKTWQCPNCEALLTVDSHAPVHTPQGPVYVASDGQCPDCGLALDDDWSEAGGLGGLTCSTTA